MVALAFGAVGARAQIIPTTSSIAPPDTSTTTAATVPETTTSLATTTTTAAPETTTSGAPRPTTTVPRPTSPTFVPPAGVSSTTASTSPAGGSLDADTGKLPVFVSLSLGGFAVAIAIVTVQWVRSRPRREAGP